MAINIDLSKSAEELLRRAFGGELSRAALEALVIEGYRSGKLGIGQVREVLGLDSRWDAEAWLGGRGVDWNYSLEDLEEDRATLAKLLPDGGQ